MDEAHLGSVRAQHSTPLRPCCLPGQAGPPSDFPHPTRLGAQHCWDAVGVYGGYHLLQSGAGLKRVGLPADGMGLPFAMTLLQSEVLMWWAQTVHAAGSTKEAEGRNGKFLHRVGVV